jgi:3-hydroxyisobutyrate dehydrogenase-like beta-hydroxyacid dehydrogenase
MEAKAMDDRNLGFVGVGRMGGRLARRLIDAGYELTVFDTDAEVVGRFVALGARRADSAAAVADAAEIVIVSLPTPSIVESVALGPKGISSGSKVKIFIDTSTTGADYAKRIAAGLQAHHIVSVDAPVSGGLPGAEAGTLAVMLACPKPVFERLKPIMSNLGTPFLIGTEPGQGQTMKLLNNLLSASAMAISAEALVMGVKAGLDPSLMMEVINAGTGRNSATVAKIPKHVIPRTFSVGFAISLLNKDVRLCLAEADALGVPMVVGTAVRQMLAITAASEGGDADMTEIVRTVERWAGIKVGASGS